MTREQYLKQLIFDHGYNVKSFAEHIGIPYTTLCSIFNRGLGGAAVDTVIKMCHALDISVDSLENPKAPSFHLSKHEQELIIAYRSHPEFQAAIDSMLRIEKKEAESDIS